MCDMLNMIQDLLNYYIQKGDNTAVLETCKQYGKNEPEIWIQALSYFRD